MSLSDQIREQRLQKLQELRDQGVDPYYNKFAPSHTIAQVIEACGALSGEQLEGLVTRTSVWPAVSCSSGSSARPASPICRTAPAAMQIYLQKQVLGEEAFGRFQKLVDLGDIIGVEGTLFRTRTNELTLAVRQFTLLTKSLQTLPEKFHGLTDVETRYRQRYVDLIVNPEVREVFVKRSRIITLIRQFLTTGTFWRWRPR